VRRPETVPRGDGKATIESKTKKFPGAVSDGAITASTPRCTRAHRVMVIRTAIAREDGKIVAKVTQKQAFSLPRTDEQRPGRSRRNSDRMRRWTRW